jgi:hypothetical protein
MGSIQGNRGLLRNLRALNTKVSTPLPLLTPPVIR